MVIPFDGNKPLEVRDENGRVIAHLVSAEQMNSLQVELEVLRKQVATLQRQKDHYIAELTRVLQTSLPIPPSEEEMASVVDNSHEIQALIAEFESR